MPIENNSSVNKSGPAIRSNHAWTKDEDDRLIQLVDSLPLRSNGKRNWKNIVTRWSLNSSQLSVCQLKNHYATLCNERLSVPITAAITSSNRTDEIHDELIDSVTGIAMNTHATLSNNDISDPLTTTTTNNTNDNNEYLFDYKSFNISNEQLQNVDIPSAPLGTRFSIVENDLMKYMV